MLTQCICHVVDLFADTRDVTNLLGRAGFTLTTVDTDEIRVAYPSMWELMDDLRDMGESNAVVSRFAPPRIFTCIGTEAPL
jgi:hypothetical protein